MQVLCCADKFSTGVLAEGNLMPSSCTDPNKAMRIPAENVSQSNLTSQAEHSHWELIPRVPAD